MASIASLIEVVAASVFNAFKVGAVLIVSRVLAAFGLTIITLKSFMPDLKAYLVQYAGAIPPEMRVWLAALGLDVFMTIIVSALVVRISTQIFIVPTSVAQNLPRVGQ